MPLEPCFVQAVLALMRDPGLHGRMREAARRQACDSSWDRVFEDLYEVYGGSVTQAGASPAQDAPVQPLLPRR